MVCVSLFLVHTPGYTPVPPPSSPDRINHLPLKKKTTQPHTGCTAWVTNRIPDPLKAELRANRSLEFLWATTAATAAVAADGEGELGEGMLTHALDTHYESPAGMYVLALFWGVWVVVCRLLVGWLPDPTDHTHTRSTHHTTPHPHQGSTGSPPRSKQPGGPSP